VRGIIEGFHGEPWSHAARLQVIEFAGRHGFDTYVYAPQDEPKRRRRWRELYDAEEMARFQELGQAAAAAGVRLVYGVSPGREISFSDAADFHALSAKVEQMRGAGFDGAMLAFDDAEPTLGERDARRFGDQPGAAHAYLANWLYREQRTLREPFRLILVPTESHGSRPTPYLAALAELLNREIDVVWTGPEVRSPTIAAAQAREFAALVGRPPVLWDNYPCNDFQPTRLFLGPVGGRAADLPRALRGVLVNPMHQARASFVPLLTYAAYLADPGKYDPEAALRAAVAEVGGPAADALDQLVEFQRDSPMAPRRRPAARLLEWMSTAARATDRSGAPAVERVEAELRALEALPGALAEAAVPGLAEEVAPWAGKLARAAALAHAALTGTDRAGLDQRLQALREDRTEIGEPLLDFAESLLKAEPVRAAARR
jgi:hyaluronoglucosaminidase